MHQREFFHVERQRQELASPQVRIRLAFAGPELTGFSHVEALQPPPCVHPGGAWALYRYGVDQPWHDGGVAHPLLGAAIDAAREAGARRVWLPVRDCNPRTMAYYRKSGFTEVGTTRFAVGNDLQNDRVFVLELQDWRDADA